MSKKRILFVNQEIAPYLPAGQFSTFGRELPQGIQEKGFEVRTFMPKYGSVNERRNMLHEVIRLSGINIAISDNDHPLIIKVASMQPSRIQVYFIDSDDFFQKADSDVDVVGSNRNDNDERAIFFARGTMETVKKLRWEPAVIHCAGWITAFAPLYMKKICGDDPAYRHTKTVYSVLPCEIGGEVDPAVLTKLKADGISAREIKKLKNLPADTRLLHRAAVEVVDAVIFHTPEPDPELLEIVKARDIPYLTADQVAEGYDAYADLYNKLSPSK